MFQTSELARLLGVARSYLHYYDREGIIQPQKDTKKFRQYSETDLIALASAKYYRAMNMDLEALKGIVHTSGLREKNAEMNSVQNSLREQISFLQDALVVTEYAKSSYEIAYREESCSEGEGTATDFVIMTKDGELIDEVVDDPITQDLLQQFPFISYSYHFPKQALVNPEAFAYSLGIATIHDMVVKRNIPLPSSAFAVEQQPCIFFNKEMSSDIRFTYEDFEPVRAYAKEHGLVLTGEAVAYCVFTNYDHEQGKIRFVIQNFVQKACV